MAPLVGAEAGVVWEQGMVPFVGARDGAVCGSKEWSEIEREKGQTDLEGREK